VDPEHVVTCAHVVPGGRHAPEGVVVEFPDKRVRHATVVAFEPPGDGERGDVAVLRLTGSAPPDVSPARLAACGTVVAGREVRAYRLTAPGTAGEPVPGRLFGGTGTEWIRLDEGGGGTGIRLGGTDVLDPTRDEVIGIVVADARLTSTGSVWMLPVEAIASYWPDLGRRFARPADAAGATVNGRRPVDMMDLVLAIADLPTMRGPQGRDQVVSTLRWQIASAVPRHPERRFDVLGIVRTCRDYPDGLAELVKLLHMLEGGSAAMRKVERMAADLPPDAEA
jgi:hypothetical protein